MEADSEPKSPLSNGLGAETEPNPGVAGITGITGDAELTATNLNQAWEFATAVTEQPVEKAAEGEQSVPAVQMPPLSASANEAVTKLLEIKPEQRDSTQPVQ
jgi:hypothetical protein